MFYEIFFGKRYFAMKKKKIVRLKAKRKQFYWKVNATVKCPNNNNNNNKIWVLIKSSV